KHFGKDSNFPFGT
uniref:Venom peptide 1 n=1 Tax=Tityus serrulatus TaxID=6887 RepID=NDB4S_TITSE|nr:RecName: Full=Venom peptide 1; Contains: RecName: Full=Venom peptide 2 [Tityus serrulatus]